MPLRSTLVGAASGVLLLAGVVGFAVGLPEVTGGAAASDAESNDAPVADLLPATLLDGSVTRLAEIDPEYEELAEQVETYGAERLTDAFGTDVATAYYATSGLETQVAVTVYDGESGLFLQGGPPVPPEMSNGQPVGEVVREGESVCIAQWDPQSYAQQGPPRQVQCQRVVDGVTVNVFAAPALTVEQTVELVDDVVAQADLG